MLHCVSTTSDLQSYAKKLTSSLEHQDWNGVATLERELLRAWSEGNQVYICGNGGSAAIALHWANDLLHGIAPPGGDGIRIVALPSNTSTLTCLANDLGYEEVFSKQLATFGKEGDVLIVLSVSGNSKNIVRVLEKATDLNIKSFALLGFSGGMCNELADVVIHFPLNDVQIIEDMQLIAGHMLVQSLKKTRNPRV